MIDPPANQSINQQPSSSERVQRIAATTNEPSSSRTEPTGSTSRATGLVSAWIPDTLVDVQLNASVGLHRSIELIATKTDRPVADNIRDAMMAALVAVENQAPTGVTEPMPIRSTETAYASVAMVLGTVALAAQRKRLSKKSGETAGAGPGDRDMD